MMKPVVLQISVKRGAIPLRSKGFTLMELMLALALGVVLMLGIVQMFSGLKGTYGFQEGMARVQEGGRIAISLIAEKARMTGFRRPVWDDPQIGFYPLTGASTDGGSGKNDTLQVMYMDDTDCFGASNGAEIHLETNQPTSWYKQVTFSVDVNDNLIWSCDYGASVTNLAAEVTAETVISGVDSFQVLYGVDTDLPQDFSLNSWVVASAIKPQNTICAQSRYLCETAPGSLIASLKNGVPVSIQVGLLLRSPDRVMGVDNVAFTVLDEEVAAAGDGFYRQLFVTTINLRNLTL